MRGCADSRRSRSPTSSPATTAPGARADGRLRGRARHGECAWILHYGLGWVSLRSLKVASVPPVGLSGVAFLYGYCRAALRGIPQVEDEDFRRFVRRELRARMRQPLKLRQAGLTT